MQDKDKLKTGTTTVGIVCDEGLVLAADKRASMGYMIAHKNVRKIYEVIDSVLMTIAGGVGDAQMLLRYIKSEAKLYELTNKRPISLNSLSTLISHILYGGKNQFMPFYVQFLLGGRSDGRASLFVLGPDGASLEDKYIATGSGSVFAYGLLQEKYDEKLSLTQSIILAVKSVNVAIQRDLASGDGIDVAVIDKTGVRFLDKEEIEKHLKQAL